MSMTKLKNPMYNPKLPPDNVVGGVRSVQGEPHPGWQVQVEHRETGLGVMVIIVIIFVIIIIIIVLTCRD